MTAEFIDPKSAAIVFAQRDYLRLHRDPPQEFNVWAGFYTSNKYSSSLYHHSGYFSYETKIYKKGSTSLNTQATVIIVGRLFLQVASCAIPDAQFRLKNEEASRPRRIWPPSDSDIDWPPPQAIGNDELDIILMGLHRAFEATD
ncbi:MAG: hypothetical protein ISR48_00055 [Alphaproteobacteria bacterium]|nr:hypothetical protein [Alphaproteobacteria bacterium]